MQRTHEIVISAIWQPISHHWAKLYLRAQIGEDWFGLVDDAVVTRVYSGSQGDIEYPELQLMSAIRQQFALPGMKLGEYTRLEGDPVFDSTTENLTGVREYQWLVPVISREGWMIVHTGEGSGKITPLSDQL